MNDDYQKLPGEDDALFQEHCVAVLARDETIEPPPDEAVHAYLTGDATDEEEAVVEEAMMVSKSFVDELLEMAVYLDSLQPGGAEERPVAWYRRLLAWRPRLALAASVVAIALIGTVFLARWWQARDVLPEVLHLAVLPIECVGDPTGAAFCDGLLETVTREVSVFERFKRSFWVVPADAMARAQVSDAETARRRFGATMAVTGNMERLQDSFNLTLELINLTGPADRPLRSIEITGPLSDLATLQVSVARQIGEVLGVVFLPDVLRALTQGDTPVSEAYESYVEGRGYLLRYEQMAELENAASAFTRAVAEDPSYALAHTGLAETYWRMYRASGDTQWIARAREQSDRALSLDDDLAASHVMRGRVLAESGEYDQAVASYQRAAAIDSTAGGLYNGLADAYAGLDSLGAAENTFMRAIALKPDYWGGYNDLGLFYYRQGRFDEAAEQYRRITELTPDNYLAFSNLGAMYYYLERWDDAQAAFEQSIAVQPSDRAYLNLATIHYIQGDYETAAELSEQAVAHNDANYRAWANLANARYWLPGQRDSAIVAYRRAIELGEARLEVNPDDARMRATLAGYYVVVDEPGTARAYIDTALADAAESTFVLYLGGYVYEQLGDRDRALELIERAVELGYPVDEIERDPWLDDLRADPRYQQILDAQE